MKNLLLRFALPLAGGMSLALLAPASALAATITASDPAKAVLPSDGSSYTLNGTFDQLDVSGSTMTFTMAGGESVDIVAENNRILTNDGGFTYSCSAHSSLTLNPSASATINVTPGASCSGSGGSSSSSGGSSGGGGGSVSTVVTTPTATTTVSTTPAQTTPVAATPTTTPWAPVSGLTEGQITSILDVLKSFNADQSVVDMVNASLHGQPSSNASAATTSGAPAFAKDLQIGAKGADVKALQQYLNTHGYQISASGPGSPGKETTMFGGATKAALAKLQKAAGLTPAAGYFGAKTRAYVNAHP